MLTGTTTLKPGSFFSSASLPRPYSRPALQLQSTDLLPITSESRFQVRNRLLDKLHPLQGSGAAPTPLELSTLVNPCFPRQIGSGWRRCRPVDLPQDSGIVRDAWKEIEGQECHLEYVPSHLSSGQQLCTGCPFLQEFLPEMGPLAWNTGGGHMALSLPLGFGRSHLLALRN